MHESRSCWDTRRGWFARSRKRSFYPWEQYWRKKVYGTKSDICGAPGLEFKTLGFFFIFVFNFRTDQLVGRWRLLLLKAAILKTNSRRMWKKSSLRCLLALALLCLRSLIYSQEIGKFIAMKFTNYFFSVASVPVIPGCFPVTCMFKTHNLCNPTSS